MKLADITPYFHQKSGGIRRYLLEKSAYLQKKGVEHVLVVPGKKRKTYYLNRTKVYEVPSFPIPLSGGYRFFNGFKEIREIIEQEKPHIVELGGTYIPIDHFISPHYRLVVFYHSDIRTDLSLVPMPNKLRQKLIDYTVLKKLAKADLIITPSSKQEDFLKGFGLEKVITVNLGVDTKTFSPSKRNPYIDSFLGVREGTYKLIYAGRLSPEKNIDLLLEVLDLLEPSTFHTVIVGDGSLRWKVERFAKRRMHITYLGYVQESEKLAELYASCDIFLSASSSETYGLAFLEAQACGCILVAPDMDLESQPFKEFLVKEQKPESFYEAIIKAVNSRSLSLRETISSYIREHFSWEYTFERLMDVYSTLLECEPQATPS